MFAKHLEPARVWESGSQSSAKFMVVCPNGKEADCKSVMFAGSNPVTTSKQKVLDKSKK